MQRKAFRRSISIVLRPLQPVIVRAPRLTSLRTICEFLDSRESWIAKNLLLFKEQEKLLPSLELKLGATYPFMGRQLVLRKVMTPLSRVFVSADDEALVVYVPKTMEVGEDMSFAHGALREFYKLRGQKVLKERAALWAERTGFRPKKVTVREARTRWGSCHPRGTVSLNWRLMVYRVEVIDYVVVHELSHLVHANHSQRFWNLVEEVLPGSKALAHELRDQHRLSDFLQVR